MKYFLPLLIFTTCSVFSCKSFDNSLLYNKAIFDKEVKPMRVVVNDESIETCFEDSRIKQGNRNDISMVIKNNLHFETDSANNYLSIIVRKMEWEMGAQWCLLSTFTLGILNILGVPANSQTITVHLSAAVMNSRGEILKTYEAAGTETVYNALYYGFNSEDSFKTVIFKAIINACTELRVQLKKDAANINKLS